MIIPENMKRKTVYLFVVLCSGIIMPQCSKDNGGINFFTVNQDRDFGEQLDSLIINTPEEYNVLDAFDYPDAYDHIEDIMNSILNADEIKRKNDFDWTVRIIDEDILNAFAAPGGYLYFYTGLMKYLDNEAQLAGVMAHEIAHADRRHSTQQMTKVYGFQVLLSILMGDDPSKLAEIAAGLASGLSQLAFSRDHEYEADEYAVKYTADTKYYPKGISGFFEKMNEAEQQNRPPEFLSTHPDPGNRLEAIDEVWRSLGSPDGGTFENDYSDFMAMLP